MDPASLDLNETQIDGDGGGANDCDDGNVDFPQLSRGENSDALASTDKSEILLTKQRSFALDAKYIEKDETAAENVQEFLRQTDELCKSVIAGNKEKTKGVDEKQKSKEISNVKIHEIDEKQKTLDHSKQLQEKAETPSSLSRLFDLHERPQTDWYQTNYLIILSIHAPNIDDYLYFSAYVNRVQQVLILNFLGTVESSLVSHEMRDLNVAVRLLKSIELCSSGAIWKIISGSGTGLPYIYMTQKCSHDWLNKRKKCLGLSTIPICYIQRKWKIFCQQIMHNTLNSLKR